jgi:cell division protein FtsB
VKQLKDTTEEIAALQTQNNELREEVKELKNRPALVTQTSLVAAT